MTSTQTEYFFLRDTKDRTKYKNRAAPDILLQVTQVNLHPPDKYIVGAAVLSKTRSLMF